jgi:hypothetical protein
MQQPQAVDAQQQKVALQVMQRDRVAVDAQQLTLREQLQALAGLSRGQLIHVRPELRNRCDWHSRVLRKDGKRLVRRHQLVVERRDRDLHRLEHVGVGMLKKRAGRPLELVGDLPPAAAAAADRRANQRER